MLAALLALPGAAAAQAGAPLESQASGLFINAAGQVLTAAHAVTGCASLYALKDGQVRRATVVARDDARDLALLDTGFKPYLSATFAATPESSGGRPVFTEAYGELQRMPARASTVFNGMTAPHGGGSAAELLLFSPVKPGASGSPVLGGAGLVLGMVVERVAVDGRLSGTVALSRRGGSAPGAGATRVKAVPVDSITGFLREQGAVHAVSDRPQLGAMQAQAPRAATLSAGIICG
ncbi:MAG: trypsin-like peptidase domain-containing protein [Achromobacter sp.]|nr:trypsin-like peptidase domain-containing protein [Achromobacter sp.]